MDLPYSADDLPTAFEDGYTTDQQVQQVAIGECDVTDDGTKLVTYGLGSCLGVALYDDQHGIAGLVHIKRPTASSHTDNSDALFADTGIRKLVGEMESYGAAPRHITAKIAGGIDSEDAASAVNMRIGKRNIKQAKRTLSALGIAITGEAVDGDEAISLFLDGETGEVTVETESTTRQRI